MHGTALGTADAGLRPPSSLDFHRVRPGPLWLAMSLERASTSLPVLALPADILFPATQLTVNLPRALVNPLTHLVRDTADSGAPPLVAAVPSLEPIVGAKDLDDIRLHAWGCGKPVSTM